ncbi:invasion plasmid antigen [Shigella flexneri 2a]|nr:invasion plasmid antigen [Shigella flexneri 2a]
MSIMLPINNNFSLSQNSFYNTISGTYADYFSAWDKWEKQALPGENRNEAVSLLKECLINQFSELQLNRLNLSSLPDNLPPQMKWHTEFGHLNRGDMLTSEQHRCSNEKKKF